MSRSFRTLVPAVPIAAAVVFAMTSTPRRAVAEPSTADLAERSEKCATRLFTAMVGEGATAEAIASGNPQASFDTLVKDPRFQERFARFINSQFNATPGATPSEDASYYLTKYVLTNGKPWSEMFVGRYDVAPQDPQQARSEATVSENAEGLGYFKSRAWMVRYAGNESAGIRIAAAYRMMQNTIGLTLSATTNSPDVDISAAGRKAPQCAGCHYNPWFALDNVAAVLGKKTGMGNATEFDPPAGGPQQILGGIAIANDRELVEALVANDAFNVNACRLAFRYLYGRNEYSCEGPVFDTCVDAFKKDKTMTSALAVIAKDPTFCE
ncbi:MAG TPA: hypothetical protein VM925_11125 [Labilithrix sp.]|nr:hypothetical protein [Labilithrix sp.]